jgi:hypothetical protein
MASADNISILVEFTYVSRVPDVLGEAAYEARGGLEMLFSDERKHKLSVPAKDDKGKAVTVGWLVDYLCEEVMKDSRKEMFVLDGHV